MGSAWGQGAVGGGQGWGVSWGAELSGGGLYVGGENRRVGFHHRARGGGGMGGPEESFSQCGALLGRQWGEADAAPPTLLGGGRGAGAGGSRMVELRASTQAVLKGLCTST